MVQPSTTGQVVWHDLLTTNVGAARKFYAELLGWTYEVEHAEKFVWKSGEADYPLILDHGEAHGGFIAIEPDQQSHWLAFVAVDNVDDAAKRCEKLGGTIERTAFDIPGVGRSAVIRDPQGALICPFVASHDYPAPTGLFTWDNLLAPDIQGVKQFYEGLFPWSPTETEAEDMSHSVNFTAPDDQLVTGASVIPEALDIKAQWVPYMTTANVDASVEKAGSLGAQIVMAPQTKSGFGRFALLRDPTGALFALLKTES
ncbi:VOC family protein [Sphingorhabdus sp. Alg231-15]|uniref:VOC family protein n=1 Tax=Sphingorhabdus sp. Alg231-15 TaxID=1922222 RepID=UPI000D5612CE